MKFNEVISIESGFKRSINLKSDQNSIDILNHYLYSQTAEHVLNSMVDHILSGQAAFTWTGPYGSGKSSLALFLSSLLSTEINLHNLAQQKLTLNKEKIKKFFDPSKNWNVIPIIGKNDNIISILAQAFHVEETNESILNFLESLIKKNQPTIIIIDEMGKIFESLATKNNSDIFILQQIAELTNRSNGNLIFIGILHQSVNEYARNLPRNVRNEWLKIHGRFIDLSVNAAGEEQIYLISKAITKSIAIPDIFTNRVETTIDIIAKNKPINKNSLKELLINCWPLDPVVVSLLGPVSRKRFGQNQRSIFSFLSSAELHGFQYFLKNYDLNSIYSPEMFWDYLQCNFENSILASTDAKIWIIAQEAISRGASLNSSNYVIPLLKTIAIIEILKNTSGLQATKVLIEHLFNFENLNEILTTLIENSIIRYNKFSNSFHLFEGSDFNLDDELDEAYKIVNLVDINKLNDIANFKPVIAKRHYHQTGCMRWLNIELYSVSQFKSFNFNEKLNAGEFGKFIIILPQNEEELSFSKKALTEYSIKYPNSINFILGIIEDYSSILDYLKELIALQWLSKNCDKLSGDKIARKEVDNRHHQILSLLSSSIDNLILHINWYSTNGVLGYLTENNMSSFASSLADKIFHSSPLLKTEMLNRGKPSANANAALNLLLKHMVKFSNEPKLAIQGFPAEGGLYRILLENTGIHKSVNQSFYFLAPDSNNHNLELLWETTDNFLKNIDHNVMLLNIYNLWSLPPLGIKKGLYVFLMATYLLTRKSEVAVYLNGKYFPELNDLFIDYLIKETSNIEVRFIQNNLSQKRVLTTLVNVLEKFNLWDNCSSNSPLEISRSLVRFIDNLNPWVLRTKSLDAQTLRFRDILKKAHDPNKLIFDEISNLFNFDNGDAKKSIENSLTELSNAYPNVINSFKTILFKELQVKATKNGIKSLAKRARNILNISGDYRVNAFSTRIVMFADNSNIENVIEGLMSLTINRPTHDWIDLDIEKSKIELAALCNDFRRTELYAHVKGKPVSRHAINIVTGLKGSNNVYGASIEILDDQIPLVETIKQDLKQVLSDQYSSSIILAALSELGADYMKILNPKDELIGEEL